MVIAKGIIMALAMFLIGVIIGLMKDTTIEDITNNWSEGIDDDFFFY